MIVDKLYKKTKEEGCSLTYEVNAIGDDFNEIEQNAFIRVQNEVTYPGFRKGKVPFDIIKRHFYDTVISEMREILAKKVIENLFEKEGIFPVVSPAIFDFKFDNNSKKISFNLYIEQNPKFEPKYYTDFEVEKNIKEITDKDVENHINMMREYNAYLKPVEGTVSKNHYLIVDWEVYQDGKKINELKNELVDMSSGQNIPGFENAVIGANKGDTKEFETEFDGKKMKMVVKINDIKEKVIPEIDDAFLKNLGVNSIDDLKKEVKKMLEINEEEKSHKQLIESIENHLISKNEFPLPPTLIKQETEELFEILKKRSNVPPEQKVELKDYEDKIKPIAERNLKITYILNAIAQKEKIKATEDDFYNEMDRVIKSLKTEEEIKKTRELFEQRKNYIIASLTENKTLDFIKSKIKIKEVKK